METEDYIERLKEFASIVMPKVAISKESWEVTEMSVYLECCLGTLIKTFKVEINNVFAAYFMTDYPKPLPCSLGHYVFPREWNLFYKRLVCSRLRPKDKHSSAVYSLFQGLKKGLLPIRPDAVDQSLLDHKAALTKDVPITDRLRWFTREILEKEFQDVVLKPQKFWNEKVLRGADESSLSNQDFSRKKKLYSNHSTVCATRSSGGQIQTAKELYNLTSLQFVNKKELLPSTEEFMGFVATNEEWTSKSSKEVLYRDRSMRPVYGVFLSERDIYDELTYARKNGLIPELLVQPAVILEPLKGRIITKPADGEYLNYGDIQKFLFDTLRKRREFELMGRPVEDADIYYVAGSWEFGKYFNSGDYSGATDNVSGHLSKMVLRHILKLCSDRFRDTCINSFCQAKIDYRTEPMNKGDSPWLEFYNQFKCVSEGVVEQKNGQLMGHILSFPILCILNYILFRYTYWRMEKKAPRVLVNGDDILFCCTKEEYVEWSDVVNKAGFIPSLGKNLLQTDIAQINSVLFRVRFDERPIHDFGHGVVLKESYISKIYSVPYLNFGVITGRGKGKENPFERTSQVECLRDLDQSAPEIMSLHANLSTFKYIEKFYDVQLCKDLFYKSRPRTSPLLKELEKGPARFAASLFSKAYGQEMSSKTKEIQTWPECRPETREYFTKNVEVAEDSQSHLFPGSSYSAWLSAVGGDVRFKILENTKLLKQFPLYFEERTFDKLVESEIC